ncbi:AMP-binding protein [Solibacillus sp. CAU 1738]|uniref:class I adenylate-forming enzyme family protein n=1 Tax=Solibacillus sp. CAU 1738 TaxID=3140363 RepID=UPI003260DE3B
MQQLEMWIVKRAQQFPNQLALIQLDTKEEWTYAQLLQYISSWLHYFTSKQFKQNERIAVLMDNSIHSFAILFACRLANIIYVPLNWRMADEELHAVLQDCTPALLITDEVNVARGEKLFAHSLLVYTTVDIVQKELMYTWQNNPNQPWMMIYTGGTTGKSKGVVLSYEAVTANAINTVISWGLNDQDCTLNYMPLFHTGGINALSLPVLLAGGTVVIGNKFDAEQAVRALDVYKTTISLFVPTMYQAMVETNYFQQSAFPTVKVFLSGGAPCPKTIYKRFAERGLRFKEGYGLTEAGPNNFYIDAEVAANKNGAVGKSMLFNEVKVVNKRGELCKSGEIGELYVRGSHVFSMYWNNDEETRNAMCDSWLKTGDLAKFDDEGDYFIVGRKKEMIITGGENVYPQEVEQCLFAQDFVEEVAVIGIPDDIWGESVTAFVVTKAPTEYLEELLKAACAERLGKYKVPKRFYFLPSLPKTVVGKIDKKQLFSYALDHHK